MRERERDSEPQPPLALWAGSLWHPCMTTADLSDTVLWLKLPPPLCAVLLVDTECYKYFEITCPNMYTFKWGNRTTKTYHLLAAEAAVQQVGATPEGCKRLELDKGLTPIKPVTSLKCMIQAFKLPALQDRISERKRSHFICFIVRIFKKQRHAVDSAVKLSRGSS